MADDLISPAERQLCRQFAEVVAKNVDIVATALRAPEVKRDESGRPVRPDGIADRDWNIICDAHMPANRAPLYLTAACKLTETAQKIAGRLQDNEPPVAKFIVRVVEAREYPVLDVTPEEK